jgi:hypothetical protein
MKRYALLGVFVFSAMACSTSTTAEDDVIDLANESSVDEDDVESLTSELTVVAPVDGGAPNMCMSVDQLCKTAISNTPNACRALLPAFACSIKQGVFGPNYASNFCEDACKDQRSFIKKRLCIQACTSFVNSSPGPYSGMGQTFFDEACKKAEKIVKSKLAPFCKKLGSPLTVTK